MNQRTSFDKYLEEQLKDSDFAARFKKAGEAWDVALLLASLRKDSGLSQKELARRVGTSQQQISRLESSSYEGHSLSMLRPGRGGPWRKPACRNSTEEAYKARICR